ncbi:FAD-dependent oxidoreductase [Halosimplex sp. TS25]|uniref:FAD-dependent oxidoreductase n=1 Tax=Halosimplex rarum TaxID=3396619 RepID=UPI0039EBCC89
MSDDAIESRGSAFDRDVVVVGGGPAGASAAVFTARYGLDTLVFDRGRSSIQRCAHLENYLGFPEGIDIETFYDLIHDHVEEAGCEIRDDLVESVERVDRSDAADGTDAAGAGGFVVEPQEGEPVTAERVVAATRYDGEYLWPLGGEEMVAIHDHGDEEHEHFDDEYPDADGSTPVDGLYVATPSDADEQAIVAAGRGAQTARTLIRDVRLDLGIPSEFADHHDWVRQSAELDDEGRDRDRWREWFDDRLPDGHDFDPDELAEIRATEIDRVFETYIDDEAIERRHERAQERLLDHVDDERILERARRIDGRYPDAELESTASE